MNLEDKELLTSLHRLHKPQRKAKMEHLSSGDDKNSSSTAGTELIYVEAEVFFEGTIVHLTLPEDSKTHELEGVLEEKERRETACDKTDPKRIRTITGVSLPGWRTIGDAKRGSQQVEGVLSLRWS